MSTSTDPVTAYAEAVLSGEVVAGPHVRDACRRHLRDMASGHERGLSFDAEAAERFFGFCRAVLRLSEGQFEGRPFELHPSQKFICGSLFGWKWSGTGLRRFRRAYIEQGKGNGKSPMVGAIGLYGLCADGEAGAQVYSAGATKEQAAILFADAVRMRNQSPRLTRELRPSGGPGREYNLAHLRSGSFFRPVSRETRRTGSGPRPHFALCDEVHEHPDGGVIEILERGFKFRRQPLLVMITNAGSDRRSVCWEQRRHAVAVASGDAEDDTTFGYVCALDEGDDPLCDPSCWPKANPLLGVTITEDYLGLQVRQARDLPGSLNGILRLHFCVWTDAETAWMSRAALEPCLADFDPSEHRGGRVTIGLDLSQSRDITAKAVVVQTGSVDVEVLVESERRTASKPTFDAWIEAWTPGDTVGARALRDKAPYEVWVARGHLQAPKGQSIRFDHVAQSLADDDRDFDIAAVAYDRYAFRRLEEECARLGLALPFVEHPQGGTRKGKPTEAMAAAAKGGGHEAEGLWMPGSLRLLEEAILEGRIRLLRNPVLTAAMMSAVTDEDRWGNRWLAKDRASNKIDPAVALCMAMGAAMAIAAGTKARLSDFLSAPIMARRRA